MKLENNNTLKAPKVEYETYEKELLFQAFKCPEKDTQVDMIHLLLDLIPDNIDFNQPKYLKDTLSDGSEAYAFVDVSWDILRFLETQCKKSVNKDSDFRVDQLERLDDLFVRLFERGYIPSKSTVGVLFRYFGTYGLVKSFEIVITEPEILNDSKYSHYINHSLDYAIQNGQHEFVKKITQRQGEFEEVISQGEFDEIIDWKRMANEAAKGNSLGTFKIVLQKVDITDFETGKKLLETACSETSKRDPYIIEYMYQLFDIIGLVLKWAIENEEYDIAHFYLKNDLNNSKTFKYGLEINSVGLIRLMLQEWLAPNEVSEIIVQNESLLTREMITLFEVSPADIDIVETILRWSVKNGDIELAKKMIKNKSSMLVKELAHKEDSLNIMVIEYVKKNGCFPDNVKLERRN